MKKKVNKRGYKKYKVRTRIAWMWDMDYLDQLNDEEKAFLMQFCDEYYQGSAKKEPTKTQIHKDIEMIRETWRNNNYRNKDLMNVFRVRKYVSKNDDGTYRDLYVKIAVPKEVQFSRFVAKKKRQG